MTQVRWRQHRQLTLPFLVAVNYDSAIAIIKLQALTTEESCKIIQIEEDECPGLLLHWYLWLRAAPSTSPRLRYGISLALIVCHNSRRGRFIIVLDSRHVLS